MEILEALWFDSAIGCVGMVLTRDERTGKLRGYLGVAKDAGQESDVLRIIRYGTPMPHAMTMAAFSAWFSPRMAGDSYWDGL